MNKLGLFRFYPLTFLRTFYDQDSFFIEHIFYITCGLETLHMLLSSFNITKFAYIILVLQLRNQRLCTLTWPW